MKQSEKGESGVVQDEIGGLGRTWGHPDLVDLIRKTDPPSPQHNSVYWPLKGLEAFMI